MAQKQSTGKQKQNIRVPFFGAYSNRSNDPNKDQRFINAIPESRKVQQTDNTRLTMVKRPGMQYFTNVGATGASRGMIFFKNNYLAGVGNIVYKVTSAGVPTPLITLSNSSGDLGMIWCDSVTYGEYVFICDGTNAWIVQDDFTVIQIANDGITSLTLTAGGTNYVTPPLVTISPPPAGTTATATATVSNESVVSIKIDVKGSGYVTDPTVTITPIGSGATGTAVLTGDKVSSVTVNTVGSGYTVAPNVVFSGGGGSGAAGTAVLNAGTVVSITITSEGDGYSTPPSVKITSGEGATALAFRNGFPTPHIPSPTFIDGYVILPGKDTTAGLIYNSTNDDPTDWPANEYIACEMFPDSVTALARQNNQVVAFGEISVEFLYNAANVNESPLSRNDAAAIQIGIAAPSLVYQNERFCAFVGQSESGGRAVWVIEGFQPKKVSDEFIEKILDAEGSMAETKGYGLRTMGHMLFLMNLKNQNRTLVYDFDEKIWHEWSSSIGAGTYNQFRSDHTADDRTGAVHMLDTLNGNIYKLMPNYYQDDYLSTTIYNPQPTPVISSSPILVKIRTNKFDMDTYNRKFMSGLEIVGDRYAANTANSVNISWTDDDYQTYNTPFTIPLTDEWPSHLQLGQFRRRAFNIDHSLNLPLRLESLELTYEEGVA